MKLFGGIVVGLFLGIWVYWAQSSPRVLTLNGTRYHVLEVSPDETRIICHGDNGKKLRTFPAVHQFLRSQDVNPLTLMNGGIFEPDGSPSGLLVQDGKELYPLNLKEEGRPLRDIITGQADHRPDLAAAWEAAERVGKSSQAELLEELKSANPVSRYWALIGLKDIAFGDATVHQVVAEHLEDVSAPVRIEAAAWLLWQTAYKEAALGLLARETNNKEWWTALRACRAIELAGEEARSLLPLMKRLHDRTRGKPGDDNFFIAFSSSAFLIDLGVEVEVWDFSPDAKKKIKFMPTKSDKDAKK